MEFKDVKQIAVIGSGAMGSQISQLSSLIGGYSVTITDVKEEFVAKGIQFISDGLKQHFVDKGKITQEQMDEVVGRIKGTSSLADAVKNATSEENNVAEFMKFFN